MKKIGKAADVMDALDKAIGSAFIDTRQRPGEYTIRQIHERRLLKDPEASYDSTRNYVVRSARNGKEFTERKAGVFNYYTPKP